MGLVTRGADAVRGRSEQFGTVMRGYRWSGGAGDQGCEQRDR